MPDHVVAFRDKLRVAREARGWSHYGAAQRMRGVRHQQLRNLEASPDSTRDTHPLDIKLSTFLELVRVFWPTLTLEDFAGPDCLFRIAPKDSNAGRKLKGFEAA